MENGKKPSLYQRNPDLFRIGGYVLGAGVVIISLILLIASATSLIDSGNTFYDKTANVQVNSLNYGSIDDGLIAFISREDVSHPAVSDAAYGDAIDIMRNFLTMTEPKATRVSYKDKSGENDGDTYKFKAVLDTNKTISVSIKDYNNGKFLLEISDKNNIILQYDSASVNPSKKDIRSLGSLYLPKTFNDENPTISVSQTRSGSYLISVNSCGNADIKEHAKEVVNNWLRSIDYDPTQAEFEIPDYCDGGY